MKIKIVLLRVNFSKIDGKKIASLSKNEGTCDEGQPFPRLNPGAERSKKELIWKLLPRIIGSDPRRKTISNFRLRDPPPRPNGVVCQGALPLPPAATRGGNGNRLCGCVTTATTTRRTSGRRGGAICRSSRSSRRPRGSTPLPTPPALRASPSGCSTKTGTGCVEPRILTD